MAYNHHKKTVIEGPDTIQEFSGRIVKDIKNISDNNVIDLYSTFTQRIGVKERYSKPRVLFAVTELYPFIKLGGLGYVSAHLPATLKDKGVDIRYFLPGYTQIKKNLRNKKVVYKFSQLFGQKNAQLILGTLPNGIMAYVLDIPEFFMRPHPYLNAEKKDWPDNHLRFGAFCNVAANLFRYDRDWQADILHGNDWQCGLIPAYKVFHGGPGSTIITIHNMCYQGIFAADVREELYLPEEDFTIEGYEYHNQVGFLKAGLQYADYITTVSPTYSWEICTHPHGCGLEGLLSQRRDRLKGILNGIDVSLWDPKSDPLIRYPYGPRAIATRKKNKSVLLRDLGLKGCNTAPFFAFIGRLVPQKGIEVLLESIELLKDHDITFAIMGSGDKEIEEKCLRLAEKYSDRVVVYIGCDEKLEHRIYAGADAIVMPSHFEPCGTVQLYAMRYGAIPIVRQTGGLADSVTPETGFLFEQSKAKDLHRAMLYALHIYYNAPDLWKNMQKAAMARDSSWQRVIDSYENVYTKLVENMPREYQKLPFLS